MEQSSKVWIILGAVLGIFVLTAAAVAVLFCWQRNKRRLRGFSLRAATPPDDAEFESWRRPSQYANHSEKYGIRPARPAIVLDRISAALLEKELSAYEFPRSSAYRDIPSPMQSPSGSIRMPERVRRKSSVASSIADRPPTPYSPISPSSEFRRGSISSRRSQPLIHYPSMSETSAFRFEFESEYNSTYPRGSSRWI